MPNTVYYNQGWWDEQLTPDIGVKIILPHIEHHKGKIIWCPFDQANSAFVRVLREVWHTVIHSHIADGQDFFEYEPEEWDIILSNPPYKGKRKYWERCLDFGKPFALLLPVNILSDAVINATIGKRDWERERIAAAYPRQANAIF